MKSFIIITLVFAGLFAAACVSSFLHVAHFPRLSEIVLWVIVLALVFKFVRFIYRCIANAIPARQPAPQQLPPAPLDLSRN